MKKLLKFSLLFFTLSVFFVACSDDDDENDYVIEYSEMPIKAKDFVMGYFGGETQVTHVRQKYLAAPDGTLYNLYTAEGFEIDFDANGVWTSINGTRLAVPDKLFGVEIPLAIKTYVNTNHTNLSIMEIDKKVYGYEVELSNDLELIFDKDGQYITSNVN